LNDTLSEQALRIKNSADSSKAELLLVQNKTQQELDSMNKLLNNDQSITSMSKNEFNNLRSEIGEKFLIVQRITALQPLEQKFNTAYQEFSNADAAGNLRKEKLIELNSASKEFRDSIASALYKSNVKK
jgi:hypothetical protein